MEVIQTGREEEEAAAGSHLTEEHEHPHVELQQPGDTERPSLCAAQWIKQQLSAQRTLPFLGPHINLLLAVGKRTVLAILALLALLHLCGNQGGKILTQFHSKYLSKVLEHSQTFTEYKCPQKVIACRSWADPLPRGVI